MHKLSCTIITLNEAAHIARCIDKAWQVADEVIVVDSGSTDDTIAIAKSKNATVIYNDWVGYGPQKRFAADQASHAWVLNLDADEVLTAALITEIKEWKEINTQTPYGYRFKFVTVYPHHEKPRLCADFHDYIRLYNKEKMRFRDSLTHDAVVPDGHAVGRFKGDCLHYSFKSLEHLKMKLDRYTDLQAKEITKPLWLMRLRRAFEYPILFIRYYLGRGHIFGGLYGLKVAHIAAKYRGARIRKFIEAQRLK